MQGLVLASISDSRVACKQPCYRLLVPCLSTFSFFAIVVVASFSAAYTFRWYLRGHANRLYSRAATSDFSGTSLSTS